MCVCVCVCTRARVWPQQWYFSHVLFVEYSSFPCFLGLRWLIPVRVSLVCCYIHSNDVFALCHFAEYPLPCLSQTLPVHPCFPFLSFHLPLAFLSLYGPLVTFPSLFRSTLLLSFVPRASAGLLVAARTVSEAFRPIHSSHFQTSMRNIFRAAFMQYSTHPHGHISFSQSAV